MYECFHCGERAVIWDSDFSFEDYGYDGHGIIHECHCGNCGAVITYYIAEEDDVDVYDDNVNENDELNIIKEVIIK